MYLTQFLKNKNSRRSGSRRNGSRPSGINLVTMSLTLLWFHLKVIKLAFLKRNTNIACVEHGWEINNWVFNSSGVISNMLRTERDDEIVPDHTSFWIIEVEFYFLKNISTFRKKCSLLILLEYWTANSLQHWPVKASDPPHNANMSV